MNPLPNIIFKDEAGVEITLTQERWDHIVSRHPEVKAYYPSFSEVIKSPDVIIGSRIRKETELYHKKYDEYFLILVVDKKKKFIVTAYLSSNVKIGDVVWKKE